MQLDDALDDYALAVLDLSKSTRRWYSHKLQQFAQWCHEQKKNSDFLLEDITPPLVRKYLDDYRTTSTQQFRKPPTTHTIRGSAQVIRGFLNWCADEKLLLDGAERAKRIKLPRADQQVIETFTHKQVQAMFAACKGERYVSLRYRDQAMLALALGTGVRASELCGLKMSDIHLDRHDPRGNYITVLGKGRKERQVGLPTSAVQELNRYIRHHRGDDEERVFLGRDGEPLTPSGLYQWMERLGEKAHITGVRCSPHTLRHTFAVQYLLAGGDVYMLSRILGHSTVSTTEIYLRSMQQQQIRSTSFSVLDRI